MYSWWSQIQTVVKLTMFVMILRLLFEVVRPPTNEALISEMGLAPDEGSYGIRRRAKGGRSMPATSPVTYKKHDP